MSVNKVILIGNVGRDPEVRYLEGNAGPNGQATKMATFTLATSERYRDRNGELRENTEWHNIVAWRQSADVAEKFVRKGTPLYIEGKLRTRSYTDAQNIKKYVTEIVVDTLQLIGRRDNEEGGYNGAPQPAYQPAQQPAYQPQQNYQPQQPAYQPRPAYQPAQQPAPEPQQPINISIDDGGDDLPF